jgi:hypothetical protein
MTNKEELNRYLSELSKRKPVRLFKNHKAYDRAKDRKNKRLYEIDSEEEESGIVEKT